ncbi:MAG: DUF1223 domain-containing protein [Proteobacteria bacterium]|nr:DUF1223 domain-containing protein [Pseudomonadota bacterium]
MFKHNNRIFSILRYLLPATLFALLPLHAASAADDAQPAPAAVLIELFTSQGCYSCPPADELLRDVYKKQADVIPLEFHVDYWDTLVYGFAGSWKDPFSSADYTNRQRAYNLSIRETGSMYTPQLIVQGQNETVGTRQNTIDGFIDEEKTRTQPLQFYFSGNAQDGWKAEVRGTMQGNEDLYYAIYLQEVTTDVTSGENKGKSMVNSNIVKSIERRSARKRQVSVPSYNPETEGCAVWVQKPQTGAVLAAARCPRA